jgi:predicted aspartyl protease
MAVILRQIRLAGSKGSEEVTAIFDSGATYSCIQPRLAERLGAPEALPEPMDFGTVEEGRRVTAEEAVRLNFYLDGYRFSDEFMLIPDLSERTIIGAATLQKWRMKLDFEHDQVIFDPRVTHLRLL